MSIEALQAQAGHRSIASTQLYLHLGADWLAGGAFGAEGSVIAVLICVAAGLLLVARAVKKDNIVQPFWSAKSPRGPA